MKGELSMGDTKIHAPRGKQELIVTRMYNAPRDQVFRIINEVSYYCWNRNIIINYCDCVGN